MTDTQERVRLRAREGEAVERTRRVAQRAGTLKDMMDDAPTEDGVYPVPTIAAAELAVLREMCEADSMPAILEQCSISELFRLVEGASFLDAPGALNHAQCALATRLNGKRADELRELLGASDDFRSAEDRVAALAEPAFLPEGHQLSETTVGSVGGPPALQPQPSLSGMAVTDDAKEAALGMVDVGTLAKLKGVNHSWLALARRVLCSRLSRCEGQPAPTQLAEITDLNIKVLVDSGRPWEAAAAGRMLPSLARLRWEGFTVNVAAVRGVDLDERDEDDDGDEDERPFLGGPAETALLSCIEGEGEPPLELLLAAVACAGSGEILSIPVQMMRDDSVSELDLQEKQIGVEGGMLLAYLVPVMGRLTVTNLLHNSLDAESAKMLAEAAKQKGISLCGIRREQTTADFSEQNLKPPDTILLASDLSQAVVTGGLTSIDLSGNQLCGVWTQYGQQHGTYTAEGITAIAEALRVNGSLTATNLLINQLDAESAKMLAEVAKQKGISLCGIRRDQTTADFSNQDLKLPDAILLASDMSQAIVTGALTALDLSSNNLKDEGVSAVCEAIQSNKETKLASLNFVYNAIGPVGANSVAAMVSVTGGLTSIDVSQNKIAGDGAVQLAAAVLGNLKIEIFNGIPIKKMRANSLTELDLFYKYFGVEGGMVVAGLIPVMGSLTEVLAF